jgi:hypothetical protein
MSGLDTVRVSVPDTLSGHAAREIALHIGVAPRYISENAAPNATVRIASASGVVSGFDAAIGALVKAAGRSDFMGAAGTAEGKVVEEYVSLFTRKLADGAKIDAKTVADVEGRLSASSFVAGPRLTAADCVLFVGMRSFVVAAVEGDEKARTAFVAAHPALVRWFETMQGGAPHATVLSVARERLPTVATGANPAAAVTFLNLLSDLTGSGAKAHGHGHGGHSAAAPAAEVKSTKAAPSASASASASAAAPSPAPSAAQVSGSSAPAAAAPADADAAAKAKVREARAADKAKAAAEAKSDEKGAAAAGGDKAKGKGGRPPSKKELAAMQSPIAKLDLRVRIPARARIPSRGLSPLPVLPIMHPANVFSVGPRPDPQYFSLWIGLTVFLSVCLLCLCLRCCCCPVYVCTGRPHREGREASD